MVRSAPATTTPDRAQADLGDFLEASGLLSYDPEAITRIYAGHPQRLLKRLWQTLVPIGLYLLAVANDWLWQRLKDPDQARRRARECAELLADLDGFAADFVSWLTDAQQHARTWRSAPAGPYTAGTING